MLPPPPSSSSRSRREVREEDLQGLYKAVRSGDMRVLDDYFKVSADNRPTKHRGPHDLTRLVARTTPGACGGGWPAGVGRARAQWGARAGGAKCSKSAELPSARAAAPGWRAG
jgi:hypothetical protein